MTLSNDDLKALRLLFREEAEVLREEINRRFDGVSEQILGFYHHDEARQQELLFIDQQLTRLEDRVSALEIKSTTEG